MRIIALIITLFFIFMIPWEDMIQLSGFGNLVKLTGFLMAAFWIGTLITSFRMRKPSSFQIVFYFFVFWNAVSILWSANFDMTLTHMLTWAQLLIMVIILWDLYTTPAAVLAALQMYVIGAYVAIASTVHNYFSGSMYYYSRFSASETNPDDLGAVLALGVPIAWYLASSNNKTKISGLLKLVNYAYLPSALLGIALSGTRTALIALIPGITFILFSFWHARFWARMMIIIICIVTVIFLLPFLQTLPSFSRLTTVGTELTSGDFNQRVGLWLEGFESFTEHPLIGVGSNMYRSINSLNKVAHNSFVSVLVELGIIGFILFGIIVTIVFIKSLNLLKWDRGFWLSFFITWVICASALTWEHRKPTWLVLSLIVASEALIRHRNEGDQIIETEAELNAITRHSKLIFDEN